MKCDHDESRHFYASDGTVLHPNALSCHPNYTARQTGTKQMIHDYYKERLDFLNELTKVSQVF